MPKKPQTPEGAAQAAIVDYLNLCKLGIVRRANVGMARMGEKTSNHPWAKDTRRMVRFGEVGESDLRVELTGSPRVVFVEVKAPSWKAPAAPKAGAAASTVKKHRHYLDQVQFQARQIARGNVAFFARSPREVFEALSAAGFHGLPAPGPVPVPRRTPKAPSRPRKGGMKPLAREMESQR